MSRRRSRRDGAANPSAARQPDYRHLRHPFKPQPVFSDDAVAAMHDTALRILEELGLKVLLAEARDLYAAAGARVREDMVFIGRDIVEAALATAPRAFTLRAANPNRDQQAALGTMLFLPGAGCPHASDRERGRRPGTLADFRETCQLVQAFDAIHMQAATVEPQDIPIHLRHYAQTAAQVELSDKPCFAYARGRAQVEDCFEMVRLANGLDQDSFERDVWVTTVINTNSPRQIDRPMAQGIIDFARAGQMTILTPFCLAGAMAPITVAGALTLQHAESLAAITLSQLARPGAPVMNGGFSSNVDMKSGSPAFGTPEHVKTTLGAGQLARHIGLPWRSAAGAAANVGDAQGAHETLMSLWAAVLAGATMTLHSAGWLEGGLTWGYEKFINDMEAVQTFAELCAAPDASPEAIGFDAIAEVQPGGHFFAAAQTMARYRTEFYEPLAADLSNFGAWSEAGGLTADERATEIWKRILADHAQPQACIGARDRIEAFIAKRTEAGGAPPLD